MSDFIPQLPPNRPKVDLDEQERIIAEWVANGGVIKRTPEPMPKPRPPRHIEKPTKDAEIITQKVIKKVQSKAGLSEYAFKKLFDGRVHGRELKAEVKFILQNQYGLKLITVSKKNGNGKPVKMMGLR